MPDMESFNATGARKNLYALIRDVNASHRPVRISGKGGSAVLLSAEDWSAVEETLCLNSVPGLVESIRDGESERISEMTDADTLDW